MPDIWWLPRQNQYLHGIQNTDRYWCANCETVTPLERNPLWNGEFKGIKPAPEWFTRCSVCKEKYTQDLGWNCPTCGWDKALDTPETEIDCDGPYDLHGEYGGKGWSVSHKCPICKTVFSYEDSSV